MSLWKGYAVAVVILPALWLVIQIATSFSQPSAYLDGSGFIRLYTEPDTTDVDATVESEARYAGGDENVTRPFSGDDLVQFLVDALVTLSRNGTQRLVLDGNASTEARKLEAVQAINELLCGSFCQHALPSTLPPDRHRQGRGRRTDRQRWSGQWHGAIKPSQRNKPGDGEGLHVVILSKSAPRYWIRRQQMRGTWLRHAKQMSSPVSESQSPGGAYRFHSMTWYNRFLVGMSQTSPSAMETMLLEMQQHRDFLLSPHLDTYERITWKIMWALNWTAQHIDYSYLLFVDDDCYLQFQPLYQFLFSAPRSQLYAGRVPYKYAIVNRNSSSKWFVDKRIYGGLFYPTYVWGACLIVSKDVARRTANAARDWMPWLGIDDAYIGLLVHAIGVNVTDVRNIHADEYQYNGCNQRDNKQEPILVVATDPDHLKQLNVAASRNESLCPLLYRRKRKRRGVLMWALLIGLPIIAILVLLRYYFREFWRSALLDPSYLITVGKVVLFV